MTPFPGIFPAIVTPFDSDGTLLVSSLERLIERLDGQGVHGVYVCGSTGEGMLQTMAQRKQITEVAVKTLSAGKPVLVHVGAHRLEDAVELARHAARNGAAAVSSLPPHGDYTHAEIRSYYQVLGGASDLPVFVYHLPQLYPAISRLDQLSDLCTIPNVIGLKLTTPDLSLIAPLRAQGAVVLHGRDDLLLAGLMQGANGEIGSFSNILPKLFVQAYELAALEQWQEARSVELLIQELIGITLRFPVFPAIKAMLGWSGIDCGQFLMPRLPLTATEASQLRDRLQQSRVADFIFAGADAV